MDKVDPQSAAAWCRQIRAADGLTQRQMADRLGCKHGVVSLLERGIVRSQPVARRLLEMTPQNLDAIV